MKTYNQIIRNLREDNDLTQKQIAAVIGTSYQQYQKYESGKSEPPTRVILCLAEYYGVSTDFVLGRTKFRDGTYTQNIKITPTVTADELLSRVTQLTPEGRAAVIEYISLQRLKEKAHSKQR
jgi:transcriptional regulator with XRE-family HTH domain